MIAQRAIILKTVQNFYNQSLGKCKALLLSVDKQRQSCLATDRPIVGMAFPPGFCQASSCSISQLVTRDKMHFLKKKIN